MARWYHLFLGRIYIINDVLLVKMTIIKSQGSEKQVARATDLYNLFLEKWTNIKYFSVGTAISYIFAYISLVSTLFSDSALVFLVSQIATIIGTAAFILLIALFHRLINSSTASAQLIAAEIISIATSLEKE